MRSDSPVQISQLTRTDELDADQRAKLVRCWVAVTNNGGAVGFLPPADAAMVAPAVDALAAELEPGSCRLLVARSGSVLAGWLALRRTPRPIVAHWGTIRHLQVDPAFARRGVGSALMSAARQVARDEMGLEQLRLALRSGMGLERFYHRLGWRVVGQWPGALRVAPGDDRDEILMLLAPL